uniref:Uncharacterized protein n=1 Tax=Pararge aegeria TaxID=116150 RepID=S4PTH6_9NEOP
MLVCFLGSRITLIRDIGKWHTQDVPTFCEYLLSVIWTPMNSTNYFSLKASFVRFYGYGYVRMNLNIRDLSRYTITGMWYGKFFVNLYGRLGRAQTKFFLWCVV